MSSLILAGTTTLLLCSLCAVIAVVFIMVHRVRQGSNQQEETNRDVVPLDAGMLNVEIPKPAPAPGPEYSLSCPHCGFSGPLEDLSVVGDHVECPYCDEQFEVLTPESSLIDK